MSEATAATAAGFTVRGNRLEASLAGRVDHLHYDRRARVWRTHTDLAAERARAAAAATPSERCE